jgi:hypothetical protein
MSVVPIDSLGQPNALIGNRKRHKPGWTFLQIDLDFTGLAIGIGVLESIGDEFIEDKAARYRLIDVEKNARPIQVFDHSAGSMRIGFEQFIY